MQRLIAVLAILLAVQVGPLSAQTNPGAPPDSVTERDTATVGDSSVMRSLKQSSHRPEPVSPIAIPRERSGICGSISRAKCTLWGALLLGSIGYWVGESASPQPKYEKLGLLDGGDIFGGETCYANCDVVPHKAIVFGLVGSGLGALGGWLIGRK